MKISKAIWIFIGCIGLVLGGIGAVVPMMPSFPFLLLAAFSFGKSSQRLHNWFCNTKIYKNNLESYVKGRGMTKQAKIKMVITVSLVMGFGFFVMFLKKLYIPCIILFFVWLFHVIYFVFGIKTIY